MAWGNITDGPAGEKIDVPDAGGLQRYDSATSAGTFLGLGTDNFYQYSLDNNLLNDPSDAKNHQAIASQLGALGARQQMQMGGATLAPAAQATASQAGASALPGDTRAGMMGLAGQLQAQANGQGPSLAQQRLKENTDRGMAQQLALAASARGVNPAMAMRSAADGQAQIQGQAAQESADLSQQEQVNARSQLGSVLGQVGSQDLAGRGQDIGLSSFNAGQAQQNSQFNAGAKNATNLAQGQLTQQTQATNLAAAQQQQAHVDDLTKQYLAMGFSMDQAQQQAKMDFYKTQLASQTQQEAARHGLAIQASGQQAQAAGAGLSALGTIGAAALAA